MEGVLLFYTYSKVIVEVTTEDKRTVKTLQEMSLAFEDDKNSMIAITEKDNVNMYEDFYDELDNQIRIEQSMNMIFFGPTKAFMRLDAESILHILVHTKKHLIPITRTLLAWDIITDGKTAAYLQGREFMAFGSLLNVVPEEDLYYVNFGCPSVLKYFSNYNVQLDKRKYGILVSAYRRYFGNEWQNNGSYINELGYLICGFPSNDLNKITPTVFKEVNVDIMRKTKQCDVEQTKTLYNIATHPDAYGEPYKWTSLEIGKLDLLFKCISVEDIGAIQLEAVTAIKPIVMKLINQKKLSYFTKQQILRMNPKTRRIYILRMQLKNSLDMKQIAKRNGQRVKSHIPFVIIINFFILIL